MSILAVTLLTSVVVMQPQQQGRRRLALNSTAFGQFE